MMNTRNKFAGGFHRPFRKGKIALGGYLSLYLNCEKENPTFGGWVGERDVARLGKLPI